MTVFGIFMLFFSSETHELQKRSHVLKFRTVKVEKEVTILYGGLNFYPDTLSFLLNHLLEKEQIKTSAKYRIE